MKKVISVILRGLVILAIVFAVCWGTWLLGSYFKWPWGDFWSNLITNAASSAVIGLILYWIITQPDEKKAVLKGREMALALLKIEFEINLGRAQSYRKVLTNPTNVLSGVYLLRFTREAWNALMESGVLPQFNDVTFEYQLLRVNEVLGCQ